MRSFKKLGAALFAPILFATALVFANLSGPDTAKADNFTAKDASNPQQVITFCSKLQNSLNYPCHYMFGSTAGGTVVPFLLQSDGTQIMNITGTLPGFTSPPTFNLGTLNGAATSALQTTGNTSAAATATGVGTPSDATYNGSNSATLIALLKANLAATGAPLQAGAAYGSPTQNAVSVSPTVTASSAYATGNAVGGLMTFANAAATSGGSGLIQAASVGTVSAQSTLIELWLFNANPSASTCTDKTAFALSSSDVGKVIAVMQLTYWFSGGTASFGAAPDRATPYTLPSGTSIYACAVTRAAPTFSATTDPTFVLKFIR